MVTVHVAKPDSPDAIQEAPRVETVLTVFFRRPDECSLYVDDTQWKLAENQSATYLDRVVRVRQSVAGLHVQCPAVEMVITMVRSFFCLPDIGIYKNC